jgi:hypothetical protein
MALSSGATVVWIALEELAVFIFGIDMIKIQKRRSFIILGTLLNTARMIISWTVVLVGHLAGMGEG